MKKVFLIMLMLGLLPGVQAQDVKREITRVTGDVYRFQNRFHVNMFVVTGDGVVVTDPINQEAARWLKAEIGKITDQPITHLIYSHSHGDHASGGTEYGDVPNVIAHRNAPEDIDLVEPTVRFDDQYSFKLGEKTFELTYLGPGHGTDMIATVVRPDDVAFVVDVVSAKRLFYRDFPGANVDHWMQQVKKVTELDFDFLLGGHGPVGTKRDAEQGLVYLQELRSAVLEGLKAGQSIDDLKTSVTMEKYKNWEAYDNWRAPNVEGMARHLIESGAVN